MKPRQLQQTHQGLNLLSGLALRFDFPSRVKSSFFVLLLLAAPAVHAQLVLNVPPDPAPSAIGSATTLNLLPTGVLPLGFNAGATDNSSSNVIVHVSGGSTLGQFSARSGSTLNVTSGSLGIFLDIYGGATANISGGAFGGLINAFSGSTVNLSGGSLGDIFSVQSGGSLRAIGGEFRVDGVLVGGLTNNGDTVQLDIPVDSVLSGTLTDGTPVAFTSQDVDLFANGTFSLEAAGLPAIGPPTITASTDLVPPGIRQGQTLQVDVGGIVGDNFGAGWGSVVNVVGGVVGVNMEATGAAVTISSGTVGDSFDANFGSVVSLEGGSVGNNADANNGSLFTILGGSVGDGFDANLGSQVEIAGGSLGDFFGANSGSQVNLTGTEFFLGGVELTGLPFGVPQTIADRDVELSGLLADGSLFGFDLNSTVIPTEDFFAADALLTVTRVSPFSADFDNDGDVDGDDLALWEIATAAGNGAADADSDGDSDGSDFLLWQRQNGSDVSPPVVATVSSQSVPEPSTLMLVGGSWMIALLTTRRRQSTRRVSVISPKLSNRAA